MLFSAKDLFFYSGSKSTLLRNFSMEQFFGKILTELTQSLKNFKQSLGKILGEFAFAQILREYTGED